MVEFNELANFWMDNRHPIWLYSSLSLERNIKDHRFPAKLSEEERAIVCGLLKDSLL